MIVVLIDFGLVMARLRSVAILFTTFYVSSPIESGVTVCFGSAKREIISLINRRR